MLWLAERMEADYLPMLSSLKLTIKATYPQNLQELISEMKKIDEYYKPRI